MDLEFIDAVIDDYRKIGSSNEIDVFDERGLLSRVRETIEWQSLTDEEKHKKRCFVYSVIRKTGNSESFQFEIKVIDIYELVEKILSKVNSIDEKNELKTRLIAMLEVFKYHVNEHRDTRKMQVTSFELIRVIAMLCMNVNLFSSINEELRELIDMITELQSSRD